MTTIELLPQPLESANEPRLDGVHAHTLSPRDLPRRQSFEVVPDERVPVWLIEREHGLDQRLLEERAGDGVVSRWGCLRMSRASFAVHAVQVCASFLSREVAEHGGKPTLQRPSFAGRMFQ